MHDINEAYFIIFIYSNAALQIGLLVMILLR